MIRTILIPIDIIQGKNTQKSLEIHKKIKKLKEKYIDNPKIFEDKVTQVYDQYHFIPIANVLPVLLQFPIITGLFKILYHPLTMLLNFSTANVTEIQKIASKSQTFNSLVPEIGVIHEIQKMPGRYINIGKSNIDKITSFNMNFLGLDLSSKPVSGTTSGILVPGLVLVITLYPAFKFMISAIKQKSFRAGLFVVLLIIFAVPTILLSYWLPIGISIYWIISGILSRIFALVQIIYKKLELKHPAP